MTFFKRLRTRNSRLQKGVGPSVPCFCQATHSNLANGRNQEGHMDTLSQSEHCGCELWFTLKLLLGTSNAGEFKDILSANLDGKHEITSHIDHWIYWHVFSSGYQIRYFRFLTMSPAISFADLLKGCLDLLQASRQIVQKSALSIYQKVRHSP